MINGINHMTITVNDLENSFDFYVNLLAFKAHAKWKKGAYLTLGNQWFCLSCGVAKPSNDYTHLALDISAVNFQSVKNKLLKYGVKEWKLNKSEGKSFYFLDPSGHKLELHVGGLANRLNSLKLTPYDGLELF